jgi:hypothetical protein
MTEGGNKFAPFLRRYVLAALHTVQFSGSTTLSN